LSVLKIQTGQRQVLKHQEECMPFGLTIGLTLTGFYIPVEPQAILELHQKANFCTPRTIR